MGNNVPESTTVIGITYRNVYDGSTTLTIPIELAT